MQTPPVTKLGTLHGSAHIAHVSQGLDLQADATLQNYYYHYLSFNPLTAAIIFIFKLFY